MLLKVHMMHQKEVEAFHDRRQQKLKMLEMRNQLPDNIQQVSFNVKQELMGRTVGKGGERARRVERDFDVEIRVVDATCLVRILGYDEASVEAAREEFELQQHVYPVEEKMVGWVLGKGHSQIQEVSQKAGLSYARWTGKALELCGRQQSIEDAIMLLDSHKEYFSVYQDMNKQNEEIKRSFEALDIAAEHAGLRRRPRSSSRDPGQEKPRNSAARSKSRPRSQVAAAEKNGEGQHPK